MGKINHKSAQCVIPIIQLNVTYIEAVHEGKKAHKCMICEATFTLKQSLKRHILLIHEKVK